METKKLLKISQLNSLISKKTWRNNLKFSWKVKEPQSKVKAQFWKPLAPAIASLHIIYLFLHKKKILPPEKVVPYQKNECETSTRINIIDKNKFSFFFFPLLFYISISEIIDVLYLIWDNIKI